MDITIGMNTFTPIEMTTVRLYHMPAIIRFQRKVRNYVKWIREIENANKDLTEQIRKIEEDFNDNEAYYRNQWRNM